MPENEKLRIQLESLRFDTQNPRLPIHMQGVADEKKVIDYMVKYGNIIELMTSIAEAGYSEAEPLLAVRDPKGGYIVVEGNRRLSALKLLNHPNLTKMRAQAIKTVIENAKHIPNEIPCILYPARKDVLDYLGYRHITGVKDWGALEKARYLDQLYQIHIKDTPIGLIYRKLANIIGSRSDYVFKLHMALKLYEKASEKAYYGADIKDEDIKFSWLTTALGHSSITDYLGISNTKDISLASLQEEHFKKLFSWMFFPGKSVIREVRQIADLAKVIECSAAQERLEKGASMEEALLYTSAPSESFMKMLNKAKQQLQQAKDAIEQLSEEPSDAKELLASMEKLIKTISGGLEANFNSKKTKADVFLQQLVGDPHTLAQLKKMLGD